MRFFLFSFILILFSSCYNLKSRLILSPDTIGYVYDRETKAPIENAKVTFIQEQDKKQLNVGKSANTNDQGAFYLKKEMIKAFPEELNAIQQYISKTLIISKSGYASDTIYLDLDKNYTLTTDSIIIKPILLTPTTIIDL